jgi:hypothetical protein
VEGAPKAKRKPRHKAGAVQAMGVDDSTDALARRVERLAGGAMADGAERVCSLGMYGGEALGVPLGGGAPPPAPLWSTAKGRAILVDMLDVAAPFCREARGKPPNEHTQFHKRMVDALVEAYAARWSPWSISGRARPQLPPGLVVTSMKEESKGDRALYTAPPLLFALAVYSPAGLKTALNAVTKDVLVHCLPLVLATLVNDLDSQELQECRNRMVNNMRQMAAASAREAEKDRFTAAKAAARAATAAAAAAAARAAGGAGASSSSSAAAPDAAAQAAAEAVEEEGGEEEGEAAEGEGSDGEEEEGEEDGNTTSTSQGTKASRGSRGSRGSRATSASSASKASSGSQASTTDDPAFRLAEDMLFINNNVKARAALSTTFNWPFGHPKKGRNATLSLTNNWYSKKINGAAPNVSPRIKLVILPSPALPTF